MKSLLTVMAALEIGAGLALSISPSIPVSLLLGAPLDAQSGVVIGRLAGAALLTLGIACWSARNAGPSGARGVVTAMLFYNFAAAAVLAHASVRVKLTGIGIWPAAALHLAVGVWCAMSLRSTNRPAPPGRG